MQKLGLAGKVKAGGFDLTEQTIKLLKEGQIEFTIDQQPYLQGFLPTLQMFLYKVSNTQTGLFEANTGLKFVTKETVEPYVAKSRYEGTTATVGVVK
jgi:simple sugar transport system substrate-binding protein